MIVFATSNCFTLHQSCKFETWIPRFTNLETLKILTVPQDDEEFAVPTKEFRSLVHSPLRCADSGVYGWEFDLLVLPSLVNLAILEFWGLRKRSHALGSSVQLQKLHTLGIDDDSGDEDGFFLVNYPISQDVLER